jgi:hypothetical protein
MENKSKFDDLLEDSKSVKKLKAYQLVLLIASPVIIIIAFCFNLILGMFFVVVALAFIRGIFGFGNKSNQLSRNRSIRTSVSDDEDD